MVPSTRRSSIPGARPFALATILEPTAVSYDTLNRPTTDLFDRTSRPQFLPAFSEIRTSVVQPFQSPHLPLECAVGQL